MYSYVDVPLIAMMYSSYELPDNVLDGSAQAGLLQPSIPLDLRADTVLVSNSGKMRAIIKPVMNIEVVFGLFMSLSRDIECEFGLTNLQSPFSRGIIVEDVEDV